MIKKLLTQKLAVQNIRDGINVKEAKALLMLVYVNSEVSMESILQFSDTIDSNLNKYEVTLAFTWMVWGYNYITAELTTQGEADHLVSIYKALGYTEKDLDDFDKAFDGFQIWYEYNRLLTKYNGLSN